MRWRSLETDSGWIAAAAPCTLIAAFAFNRAVPGFLTIRDIDSLAGTAFAPLLLLTLSQMLLLRVHRLEPALIGISSLVGTLAVYWNARDGVSFGFAVALSLAVVVVVFAVINGLLSALLTAPAALAVSVGVFVSAAIISAVVIGTQGVISVPLDSEFVRLRQQNAGGLPAVAIIALVVCAIVGLISLVTDARQYTSIATRREWIGLYAYAALLSGIAGILTAINLQGVSAAGDEALQEGQVIAALLVGGASLYGRRGGVASAFVGAAFVSVIAWGISSTVHGALTAYWIFAAWGLTATVCFLLDYFTRERAEAPLEG